jgi:uncharacterized protein YkwD
MTMRGMKVLRLSVVLLALLFVLFAGNARPHTQIISDLAGVRTHCAETQTLRMDPALNRAALRHARDMAANDYFSHTSLDGSSAGQRLERARFRGTGYGEVMAAGLEFASEVIPGLMTSPPHRVIMVDCKFSRVGYGYGYNGSAYYKHYWVVILGKK